LDFALRHEDLDMLVLKRLFEAIPQDTVTAFVTSAPNGTSNRRAWFLYEFLTGKTLDLPDAAGPSFADLLDGSLYFTSTPRPLLSPRIIFAKPSTVNPYLLPIGENRY
jgi:hypothetical protein